MAEASLLTVPATWPAYDRLVASLWNIEFGLSHTISTCELIDQQQRQGGEIDYFSGKPPESAIVIQFREPPAWFDNIKHELTTAIELMRVQYLPLVWENLPTALAALSDLPTDLQDDLNDLSGYKWIVHTRRGLNELAKPYRYRGFLDPPVSETGFPQSVAAAFDICKCHVSIDGWRRLLCQIKEQLEQVRACQPARMNTKEGSRQKLKRKRNTTPGAADIAILSALCTHHQFRDGGCGNWEPIGGNELAKLAHHSQGAVSNFWKRHFGSKDREGMYEDYRRACTNEVLAYKLALLRGDISSADVVRLMRENGRQNDD